MRPSKRPRGATNSQGRSFCIGWKTTSTTQARHNACEVKPENLRSKKPALLSYDRICGSSRPSCIAEDVIAEACELLKLHPHPDVATYPDCRISSGRISGICLIRYRTTLMNCVSPRGYTKRMSRSEQEGTGDDNNRVPNHHRLCVLSSCSRET